MMRRPRKGVEANPEGLDGPLRRVPIPRHDATPTLRRVWNENARRDAFFSVLGGRDLVGKPWDPSAFYATGRREVEELFARLTRLGVSPGFRTALDLGCGAGRLSEALVGRFQEVYAVDVSDAMIEVARRQSTHPNVQYSRLGTSDLSDFRDRSMDFVLSHLVLQHTGRRLALRYLREVIRVLAPHGVAELQLPINFQGLRGLLAAVLPDAVIGLYQRRAYGVVFTTTFPIPHRTVIRVVRGGGGIVLDFARADVNDTAVVGSYVIAKAPTGPS